MYALRFSTAALKALRTAPPDVVGRIRAKLDELARDPFTASNVKELTSHPNHPGYRLRVGDWQVLYLIQREEIVIQVVNIRPRKEVCR